MKTSSLLCCLLSFFLLACEEEFFTPQVNVDPEFQPYLDTYIAEATKRRVEVPIEEKGLTLVFDDTPSGANGVCYGVREGITSEHRIHISQSNWKDMSEAYREFLIFHEMGHCYEYRRHTSDTLSNRDWKSMMRGRSPIGFGYRSINYTGTRREYYVDELFDPDVAPPDWASWTRDYNTIAETEKTLLAERKNPTTFSRSFNWADNYEIEIEFPVTDDLLRSVVGFAWGNFSEEESLRFALSTFNLFISDNVTGYGNLHAFESYNGLRLGQSGKLTVQKIGDYFWYFVNEKFVYWTDVVPLVTQRVMLVNLGGTIDRITVKNLPN
ncbi:MAG: hypothetical protein AAGI23_16170 [Bacteroidota bacterium]